MNNRKKLLLGVLIFGLFVFSSCSNSKSTSVDNSTFDTQSILSKAFTVGDHSVSIMEIALPSDEAVRMNDIMIRFKSSVEKNKQWFNDYVKKYSKTGEVLPWDEKFGISKEEYDVIISSEEKMHLIEKNKTTISIVKENDGKLTLKLNQDLSYISGIKIDTVNNCIIIDDEVFEYSNEIEASDGQKVTGPWSGGSWKLVFEELKDINNIDNNKTYGSITISVGQLEKTNQIIVYYKEGVIHQGYSYKGEEIIVFNN